MAAQSSPNNIIATLEHTYITILKKIEELEKRLLELQEESDEYLIIKLNHKSKLSRKVVKEIFNLTDAEIDNYIESKILQPDGWNRFKTSELINLKKYLKSIGR